MYTCCPVHSLVLKTLEPLLKTHPNRKCYRLIGGVLVERTVVEAEGMLRTNIEGVSHTLHTVAPDLNGRKRGRSIVWTRLMKDGLFGSRAGI